MKFNIGADMRTAFYVAAIFLAIWACYTIIALFGVGGVLSLAVIAVFGVWKYAETKHAQEEEKMRAAEWANINCPVFIFSNTPNEGPAEIAARAAEIRHFLRVSGNPYADALPIVQHPYHPLQGVGKNRFGQAWAKYQASLSECINTHYEAWAKNCPAEIRDNFLSAINQMPVTAANVATYAKV